MPKVSARREEHPESILRRFKRACEKAGLLTELKRRTHYEKPTKARTKKKAAAVKRYFKKLQKEMPTPSRGSRGRKNRRKTDRRK